MKKVVIEFTAEVYVYWIQVKVDINVEKADEQVGTGQLTTRLYHNLVVSSPCELVSRVPWSKVISPRCYSLYAMRPGWVVQTEYSSLYGLLTHVQLWFYWTPFSPLEKSKDKSGLNASSIAE